MSAYNRGVESSLLKDSIETIEIPTISIYVLASPHGVLSGGEACAILENPIDPSDKSKALLASKEVLASMVTVDPSLSLSA